MSYEPATYEFLPIERVTYGTAAAEAVAGEAERVAAERVLVVTSASVAKTSTVAAIAAALESRHAGTFDGCREHTPRETVIAAIEASRAAKADLLVTVGGGSAIDTAKATLLGLAAGIRDADALGRLRISFDDEGRKVVPDVGAFGLRQIVVPTTLSGAEFSNLAGVTDLDRKVKDGYTAPEMAPRAVILDPAASHDTPDWLWLSTAIRSVDHAVETICSSAPQALADAGALHALRLFATALPACRETPDDLDARLDCQLAVWLATMGLNRVPYGGSHGIGHQLGAFAGVPHGHCSCVLLPAVMRYNRAETAERQAQIAEAMGAPGDDAADVVERFIGSLGQPTRLQDVGVTKDQFDAIASTSLDNLFVRANPRPLRDASQIRDILEAAW